MYGYNLKSLFRIIADKRNEPSVIKNDAKISGPCRSAKMMTTIVIFNEFFLNAIF